MEMDPKATPSGGCVFCDLELEHPKVICGMVLPGTEDDRRAFMKALDIPPVDLPVVKLGERGK